MDRPVCCFKLENMLTNWSNKVRLYVRSNMIRLSDRSIIMSVIELVGSQLKFAEIVWNLEPIGSGDLVKICKDQMGWKKSTTYTVLHILCDKKILKNSSGIVTSIVSKEEYLRTRGKQFVDDFFAGSLPSFIAAFASKNRLSQEDIKEIQALIDDYKKEYNI